MDKNEALKNYFESMRDAYKHLEEIEALVNELGSLIKRKDELNEQLTDVKIELALLQKEMKDKKEKENVHA